MSVLIFIVGTCPKCGDYVQATPEELQADWIECKGCGYCSRGSEFSEQDEQDESEDMF